MSKGYTGPVILGVLNYDKGTEECYLFHTIDALESMRRILEATPYPPLGCEVYDGSSYEKCRFNNGESLTSIRSRNNLLG